MSRKVATKRISLDLNPSSSNPPMSRSKQIRPRLEFNGKIWGIGRYLDSAGKVPETRWGSGKTTWPTATKAKVIVQYSWLNSFRFGRPLRTRPWSQDLISSDPDITWGLIYESKCQLNWLTSCFVDITLSDPGWWRYQIDPNWIWVLWQYKRPNLQLMQLWPLGIW